jgi:hypothetical protein
MKISIKLIAMARARPLPAFLIHSGFFGIISSSSLSILLIAPAIPSAYIYC